MSSPVLDELNEINDIVGSPEIPVGYDSPALNELKELKIGLAGQTAKIEDLERTVGDFIPFLDNKDYDPGDYVIYDNKLYQFQEAHAAGPWTGTDVEETDFAGELQDVAEELRKRITKESFENAGIISKTYTTIMDETVTAEASDDYIGYYALATSGHHFDPRTAYRVTFDNIEYILPCIAWGNIKGTAQLPSSSYWGYVGNISLFEDMTDVKNDIYDVPFLIGNFIGSGSSPRLDILTETIGSHDIKLEQITISEQNDIPKSLVFGLNYSKINTVKVSSNSSMNYGLIVGPGNKIKSIQGSVAIGAMNEVNGGKAIGIGNKSSSGGAAIGLYCNSSGSGSVALGYMTTASNTGSVSEGSKTEASGNASHAEGNSTHATNAAAHAEGAGTIASGAYCHAEGMATTANHRAQHVFGKYNVIDDSSAAASADGNYVEIVGNGTADDARSNARTLDWDGNESLAGGLTLGMGSNDEITMTAQQLKALLDSCGRFVVNVTAKTKDANDVVTAVQSDKNFSQIQEAYLAGKQIEVRYWVNPTTKKESQNYYVLPLVQSNDNQYIFSLHTFATSGFDAYIYHTSYGWHVTAAPNGNWSTYTYVVPYTAVVAAD